MSRQTTDSLAELPSAEPISPRERRRAFTYIATVALVVTVVVLAVVFDQFAATGVFLIVFLSFVLAYLIAPAVERLRYAAAPSRRGRPLSRGISVLVIYGLVAVVTFPLWTFAGQRLGPALARMSVLVPQHTARFIGQLRASEGWHNSLGLPMAVNAPVGAMTRRVTRSLEGEVRALGAELTGIRHLCWAGFAALRLPYPGTLGIAAGALEMVPLAGPLVVAVVATAMAGDSVVAVLVFLAGLRLVQDYAIYPRLISRVMHLHPVAVVLALWAGAAIGGIVGVCLAIPIVGITQVAHRHWREYREIEDLVKERAAI